MLDGQRNLLRLTDFGYARTESDSRPISKVGTPNYAGGGGTHMQLEVRSSSHTSLLVRESTRRHAGGCRPVTDWDGGLLHTYHGQCACAI